MHGTLPLMEAEFAAMREKLKSGKLRASSTCAEYVYLIRKAADANYSAIQIANQVSTAEHRLTRNAIIGVGTRANPRIRFHGVPIYGKGRGNLKHGFYAKTTKGTRKEQREASRSLSPRLSRLQSKTVSPEPMLPGAVPPAKFFATTISPITGTIVKTRRMFKPRCIWAACNDEPMDKGKPYCLTHHYQSGALLMCHAEGGVK